MADTVAGRLAVITGTNPAATDISPHAPSRAVDVDGRTVPYLDAGSVVVLHRHHDPSGHRPAHLIDHASNLRALAALGCDRVLALSSTGSLRADWDVGTVAAPDDFFAPWSAQSLFDDARGHSVPGFAPEWRAAVIDAWRAASGMAICERAVYAQMSGPRFETPAEIRWLAGCADLVGMTVAGECIVAREVGLAYAALCIVDNLANGLAPERLTIEGFHAGVTANRDRFATGVRATIEHLVTSAGASP